MILSDSLNNFLHGLAADIRDVITQTDVASLKHLIHFLFTATQLFVELGNLTVVKPQLLDDARRNKAPFNQILHQYRSDPLGILDIGLPSRNLLDEQWIDQFNIKIRF